MIKENEITFVITCFNSEKIIKNTLENIPQVSKKIIIENSGNIKLKELENEFENLTSLIMKENLGYGAANNIGIKNSNTKYIFILNPDVVLAKNDIKNILLNCNELDFSILGFTSETEKYNFPKNAKFMKAKEVKGFAMLLKRENFLDCLFDENFFLYLEEIDLCRRTLKKGGTIYILNYLLNHAGGKSHTFNSFEMEKSRNWHWMWSQFYFRKKYSGYFIALLKYLPILFLFLCKYFLYFNKTQKQQIYKCRLSGLFNSIIGNKSFYRPNLKI